MLGMDVLLRGQIVVDVMTDSLTLAFHEKEDLAKHLSLRFMKKRRQRKKRK